MPGTCVGASMGATMGASMANARHSAETSVTLMLMGIKSAATSGSTRPASAKGRGGERGRGRRAHVRRLEGRQILKKVEFSDMIHHKRR